MESGEPKKYSLIIGRTRYEGEAEPIAFDSDNNPTAWKISADQHEFHITHNPGSEEYSVQMGPDFKSVSARYKSWEKAVGAIPSLLFLVDGSMSLK